MAKKNNGELEPAWKIFHFPALFQGLVVIMLLIMTLSFGLSLVVSYSSWQSSPRLLNFLTHLSVFFGALWAGRRCQRKAWIHGIVVGLVAFALFSWFGSRQELILTGIWGRALLRVVLVGILGGMLGGLTKT